jgi:hypothetical protein
MTSLWPWQRVGSAYTADGIECTRRGFEANGGFPPAPSTDQVRCRGWISDLSLHIRFLTSKGACAILVSTIEWKHPGELGEPG